MKYLQGPDAIRPAETAAARLRWLLDMDGLFSEAAEALVMERTDYRGQARHAVIEDVLRDPTEDALRLV